MLLPPPAAAAALVGELGRRERGPLEEARPLLEVLVEIWAGDRIEVRARRAPEDTLSSGSAGLPAPEERGEGVLALSREDVIDRGGDRVDAVGHFTFAVGAAKDGDDVRPRALDALE